MRKLKYEDTFAELFLRSFFPYSKDVIRNASHENLKNYYRRNNTVNRMFYPIVAVLLFIYALMYMIA